MSIKPFRPPTTAGIYYTLPAVSGIQAGREYFIAMCPLALVPRLFPMVIDQSRPELHLQRILNPSRVPEIARYLVRHPKSYVLSSLTASVDAEVEFERLPGAKGPTSLGNLKIPMTAQLLLHDGLHRRAAIEAALRSDPELGNETIPLVLFVDKGLRRSEQMFTDLKRNEAHSGRSRSIACDQRDELARLVKAVLTRVPVFTELTEMARSTISNRSTKLFTFSGIYHATVTLLSDHKQDPFSSRLTLAVDFWLEVSKQIPAWSRASEHMVTTAELRRGYVHAHALALAAIARVGRALFAKYPSDWRRRLHPLVALDWSRSNTTLWEGRAMIGGRISKARTSVVLTGNVIKRHLGLPLGPDEAQIENRLLAHRAFDMPEKSVPLSS